MAAFEVFKRRAQRIKATEPIIKLAGDSEIWANGAAIDSWFKGKGFVLLAYDEKNRLVGLKPTSSSQNAYKWGFGKKRVAEGSARLTAKAFFKHIGLKLDRPTIFKPRWDEEAGMVVIDLKEAD